MASQERNYNQPSDIIASKLQEVSESHRVLRADLRDQESPDTWPESKVQIQSIINSRLAPSSREAETLGLSHSGTPRVRFPETDESEQPTPLPEPPETT